MRPTLCRVPGADASSPKVVNSSSRALTVTTSSSPSSNSYSSSYKIYRPNEDELTITATMENFNEHNLSVLGYIEDINNVIVDSARQL